MQALFARFSSIFVPFGVRIDNDRIKILEIVRDNCTGITRLETPLRYLFPDSLGATLKLVDTHLKAISSLKEVIFHIYSYQDPSDDLMKKIHGFGWITKVTKLIESDGSKESGEEESDNDPFAGWIFE